MSTAATALVPPAVAALVIIGVLAAFVPTATRPTGRSVLAVPHHSCDHPVPGDRPVVDRWARRRVRRATVAPSRVAAWLDEIAASVRRGESASAALARRPTDTIVAHGSDELRRHLARGAALVAAADAWHAHLEDRDDRGRRRDARLLECAAVIACAAEVGGSLAGPVERLAAAMRERAELDRERRAHSAQARMSAAVLTVLPVAVLTLLVAADGDVRAAVWSPVGGLVVGAGLGLDGLGAWWMHRIVGASR